jgi:predicted RNA-binding Zn ribbon-like protein
MNEQVSNPGRPGTRPDNLTLEGRLAVDFVNTMDWRLLEAPHEFLNSYQDLISWARHAGALSTGEAGSLLREAARRPEKAEAALKKALTLREALYRVLAAVARGRRATQKDLEVVNVGARGALARLRLVAAGRNIKWEWRGRGDDPDRVTWVLAKAASEFLVDPENLSLLRECEGEGCGWLFLDTSRNKSRRWCTMQVCGNRFKARRHYEKLHAGGRTGE